MPFERGNKLSPGGKFGNKGGGRDVAWLKAKCADLVDKKKLIEFLAAVAAGEPFVEKFEIVKTGENFEKVRHSADVKDRLKAIEMLMDRGWGKTIQFIDTPEGSELSRMLIMRPAEVMPPVELTLIPPQDRNGNGAHS